MIIELDHINIVVSDLKRAKTFFELFGFKEIDASELSGDWLSAVVKLNNVVAHYSRLSLPGSSIKIELIEYINPPSGKNADLGKANQIGYRHLAFEVSDIEKEFDRLRQHGVEFLSDIVAFQRTNKKLVYFYGPDGILLELAEYCAADDSVTHTE